MLLSRRATFRKWMVTVVFGRSGGASEVPANITVVRAWNKLVGRQKGAVADIDRSVKAVVLGTEVSLDRSSESAGGIPCADLPSPTLPSLTREADKLRKTIGPISAYVEDEPIIPVVASQETLDLLQQGLAVVAGQGDPTQRTVALAAVERAQKVQDALAAVTKVQAAPTPGQRGAASGTSTGAAAAEGRAAATTSFPLRDGPGGRVAAQVSPKPFPATVLVASPAYGEVSVTGLARWFQAHTVHAKDSGAVVDGNDCTLTATDHYHIRTVSVSFEPIMEPGSKGHDALCALLQNPTAMGVSAFQAAMSRMTEKHEHGQTQASLPVTPTHLTVVDGAAAVQQGDGSRTNITTKYVIEEIELPICELFAANRALVNAFLESVLDPEGGPTSVAFGREALRAAGRTDEFALLDYSTHLHGGESSVRGLFGITAVENATAVVVGTGNTLHTDMCVEQGKRVLSRGLSDLDRIREDASRIRAVQGAASVSSAPSSQGASTLERDVWSLIIEALTRARAADEPAVEALSPQTAIGRAISAL